jgi:hypothetical protein
MWTKKNLCALCIVTVTILVGAADSGEYNDTFSTKQWSHWKLMVIMARDVWK